MNNKFITGALFVMALAVSVAIVNGASYLKYSTTYVKDKGILLRTDKSTGDTCFVKVSQYAVVYLLSPDLKQCPVKH